MVSTYYESVCLPLSYGFAIIPTIEIQQVSNTCPLNPGSHHNLVEPELWHIQASCCDRIVTGRTYRNSANRPSDTPRR